MIIEVALGLEHAKLRIEHMRYGLLRRGLTRRSSHAHQRLGPDLAYGGGQPLERSQSVVHDEQPVFLRVAMQFFLLDDRSRCFFFECRDDVVMPVEPFALDGKEKLSGTDGA